MSLPGGWRSQNPFRSTYFAAQAMAAEMSTGAPALVAAQDADASVATLVVGLRATYTKKLVGPGVFTFEDVAGMRAAVAKAAAADEAQTFVGRSVGRDRDGKRGRGVRDQLVVQAPPAAVNVVGFAVAGGASRRMGRDKALLPWGETDLLGHALARLAAVCQRRPASSAAPGPRYTDRGVPVVADARRPPGTARRDGGRAGCGGRSTRAAAGRRPAERARRPARAVSPRCCRASTRSYRCPRAVRSRSAPSTAPHAWSTCAAGSPRDSSR